MLGVTDYGAFVVAFVLLLFLPGPGNLALITSTGQGGLRGGLASVMGLLVGDQILMWLTVAGVAALLQTQPTLFAALQWLGAAYLTWLGLKMWMARPGDGPSIRITPGHYFRQTMTITLLNPKALMFYFAFFPQFIDPAHHQGMLTFAWMALTIWVLGFVYCFGVVLVTLTMARSLRARPAVTTWLNRIAGTCLIGFGLKLALGK
ncbi:MAG: Leucine efflux protein [Pseudomonadota bacterium]|jgi:threonine/homoserine/homoserine lactone efflux protein